MLGFGNAFAVALVLCEFFFVSTVLWRRNQGTSSACLLAYWVGWCPTSLFHAPRIEITTNLFSGHNEKSRLHEYTWSNLCTKNHGAVRSIIWSSCWATLNVSCINTPLITARQAKPEPTMSIHERVLRNAIFGLMHPPVKHYNTQWGYGQCWGWIFVQTSWFTIQIIQLVTLPFV